MSVISIGSVWIKKLGREKGKKCVIVDVIDKNYVLITGPRKLTGVKRRRVNIKHLDPTGEMIKIKKGSSDKDVQAALSK